MLAPGLRRSRRLLSLLVVAALASWSALPGCTADAEKKDNDTATMGDADDTGAADTGDTTTPADTAQPDTGADVEPDTVADADTTQPDTTDTAQPDTSDTTDADIIEPPPAGPSSLAITSGGGTQSNTEYTLTLAIGAPQPMGKQSNGTYTLTLGPR